MNWADIGILAVIALSVLMGLWRGFIGEVLALAIWILAFWLAWQFGPLLAQRFEGSIATPSVRVLLAYALCFVVVLIVGALLTFLMRRLVEGSGLSGSDRLLGMVFGLARGVALVVLIVLLLDFTPFRRDPWWNDSRLLPTFENGARWLGERLPGEVSRYLEPVATMLSAPAQPAQTKPASLKPDPLKPGPLKPVPLQPTPAQPPAAATPPTQPHST